MDRTSVTTLRVRQGAVPSIFAFPKHLIKEKKVKKPPMENKLFCVVLCGSTTPSACVNINTEVLG